MSHSKQGNLTFYKFNLIKADLTFQYRKMSNSTFRDIQKIIKCILELGKHVSDCFINYLLLILRNFPFSLRVPYMWFWFGSFHLSWNRNNLLHARLTSQNQVTGSPGRQEWSQCLQSSHHWGPRLLPFPPHPAGGRGRLPGECRQA